MPIAKMLVPLSGLMLLAGAAQAQLAPPFIEWAAKFTCGQETQEKDDVVRGVYATSINIHNPQAKIPVEFIKKIVVANREDEKFVRPKILKGVLRPDFADRVDCLFIDKALNIAPATYVEGYVVIEVRAGADQAPPLLDVTAKYTARPSKGEVSTQSVVPIAAKQISN
jgi:hypothetical protein